MKVPLTREFYAIIDREDWDLVSRYKWQYCPADNNRAYATTQVKVRGFGHCFSMHRLIMGFPEFQVDHRNRNGLDNRRKNLREATRVLNIANSAIRRDNTSGAKGVHWSKSHNTWCARIQVNGKRITVGEFTNKVAAMQCRKKAAEKLYGEFHRIK